MDIYGILYRYKLTIKDEQIFDPIRKKYVHCTPEEIVRQKIIKFLIKRLEVPKNKIIVERSLNTLGVNGSKKRIDIGILDNCDLIMGIVECKALLMNEAVYLQAQNYLSELKTRYFFVTNGQLFDGYYNDTTQFIKLEGNIPKYRDLCNININKGG